MSVKPNINSPHSFEEDDDSKIVRIKDHLSHEDTFIEVFSYGMHKLHDPWYKTFLFGIMAGFFVSVAYIIVFVALSGFIVRNNNKLELDNVRPGVIALITGATFTSAMLMIVFIGGGLFTSNSLTLLPIIKKQERLRRMLGNLSLVLLGNFLGTVIVGISTYAMGYMKINSDFYNTVEYIYRKKMISANFSWMSMLQNFVSGIYCNILIAGLFWMNMSVKNSAAKVLLCFFGIFAFGISGFQHIVANSYIWVMGMFIDSGKVGKDTGLFTIVNILPTLLGNFIGGSLLLPTVYLIVFNKRLNKEIRKGKFKLK